MGDIRISVSNLVGIEIDGLNLLHINPNRKRKGLISYKPFGGVYEASPETWEWLSLLGARPEKKGSRLDLRLFLPEEKLTDFEEWFMTRTGREISPFRELEEELVQEEKVLPSLSEENIRTSYIRTENERKITDRTGQEGWLTQRYFEIFKGEFSPEYIDMIRENLRKEDTNLILASDESIKMLQTPDGINIGDNSPYIINL